MFMNKISYLIIPLYILNEVNKGNVICFNISAKGVNDVLKFWKPEYKYEENIPEAINNISSNIFHHELKSRSGTDENVSKWPKVKKHRSNQEKSILRITKMLLKQNEETTNDPDVPMEDTATGQQDVYLSPYSIKEQLLHIAKKIKNSNTTVEVLGRTVEYNDIVLLKLTEVTETADNSFRTNNDKFDDDLTEKKIVFIVHGLSVMGATYLSCLTFVPDFLKLLSYYVEHLDKFDIFLIPMANPDGYVSSRTDTNIWNKNASPQLDCPGVALDRNFDVAWNNTRTKNSCHQEYPGAIPFSEAETIAVRDIFHKYSHKIVAYLNVHAGTYDSSIFKGDAVLYPKGFTDSTTDDDKYIDLKGEIDEAIRNASFQVLSVTVDTLHNWYGKVSGSSVDYASTIYGIPYALELVMQLYKDSYGDNGGEAVNYSQTALTEVWGRVIGVIFNNIWKTLNVNEVR